MTARKSPIEVYEALRPEDCKPGVIVYYHPAMNDAALRFRGVVASEPWDLCGTLVTRLVDMEPSYSEWRQGTRTSIPSAAVEACEVIR